jgi:hypothetical protein
VSHTGRRKTYRDLGWIVPVLAVLILVISVYFQIQGAIQCSEDGGAYLRNWANWPVCVKGN